MKIFENVNLINVCHFLSLFFSVLLFLPVGQINQKVHAVAEMS